MPVSTSVHISHCLQIIINTRPRSVLDVGCGFGLWGFLCREYLDVGIGHVWPEQWEVRIDGIELFEPYIQDHQRSLYSSIQIGDIRELAPDVDKYDLIITGDVIEHLEKHEGEEVLDILYEKAEKVLLVNIPIGPGWEHPEQYGNPGELHRSQWEVDDLVAYPNNHQSMRINHLEYGVFYCPKDSPLDMRVSGLLASAEHRANAGRTGGAIRSLNRCLELQPDCTQAILLLVDLLLQSNDRLGAIHVLERGIQVAPEFHYGYFALAKLMHAMKRLPEAAEYLDVLAGKTGVDPGLRTQADTLRRSLDP